MSSFIDAENLIYCVGKIVELFEILLSAYMTNFALPRWLAYMLLSLRFYNLSYRVRVTYLGHMIQ